LKGKNNQRGRGKTFKREGEKLDLQWKTFTANTIEKNNPRVAMFGKHKLNKQGLSVDCWSKGSVNKVVTL